VENAGGDLLAPDCTAGLENRRQASTDYQNSNSQDALLSPNNINLKKNLLGVFTFWNFVRDFAIFSSF